MAKKAREPVGVVMRRPLPTDEGTHLLFISRPSTVFAQAGTAIFAASGIASHDYGVEAQTAHGNIVFHKDVPFLLIPRTLCTPVSIQDLADIQIREKKDWAKAYKGMPEDSTPIEDLSAGPGNYL
jgi:hypothetical protein